MLRRAARRPAGGLRRARAVPAQQRQPVRARAGAVLPIRHSSVLHSRVGPAEREGADSLPRVHQSAAAAISGIHRYAAGGAGGARAERFPLERARRGVSRAGLSDAGGPGAAKRSFGARESVDVPRPAIPRITRCGSVRNCCIAPAASRCFPCCAKPPGPHGPDAQRLERHFFPRDGLTPRPRAS